jgi:catechol 2,3-dioxygenase-like lactoylglutathione lyase family enzyme
MVANATYHATLPAADYERAKAFYAEKLELTPVSHVPGGAFYESNGTRFLLFPTSGAASGTHTSWGWPSPTSLRPSEN